MQKSSKGNIVAVLVVLVALGFIFFNFIAPGLNIKIPFFKSNPNAIEYSHAEGFPKALKVTEQFEKRRYVITSQEDLKQKIAEVDKNNEIKVPEVNFERKMVLFVTSKTRVGGGFEERIKKISKDKDDLVVEIRETEPGETCINTEEMTLPMDLVILDKSDLTIDFEPLKFVKECN